MYVPQISPLPQKTGLAELFNMPQKSSGSPRPTQSFDSMLQQSFKTPDRPAPNVEPRRTEARPAENRPVEPRQPESQPKTREPNASNGSKNPPAKPDNTEARAPTEDTRPETPTTDAPERSEAPAKTEPKPDEGHQDGKGAVVSEAATAAAAEGGPANAAVLAAIIAALSGNATAAGQAPGEEVLDPGTEQSDGDALPGGLKIGLDGLTAKAAKAAIDPSTSQAGIRGDMNGGDANEARSLAATVTDADALTTPGKAKPLATGNLQTHADPQAIVAEAKTLVGPAVAGSSSTTTVLAATAQANGGPTAPILSTAQAELTTGAMNVAGASGPQRAEQNNIQQLPVYTPAGHKAWAEDVGNRLIWMANRSESRAELMLTPPSLGKLEVSIQVSGDQTTAHFVAATPAAREALEQAMPRLRELLQLAGINLGQTDVSTSGEQQARQGGDREGREGFARGRDLHASADMDIERPLPVNWHAGGEGAIDIFA